MRGLRVLLSLLILPGGAPRGAEMQMLSNETARFLGDRETWSDVKIEIDDVQPLFGGTNLLACGCGAALLQTVSADVSGLLERRYLHSAEPARTPGVSAFVFEILEAAIANDFMTIRSSERPGVPDEARAIVVLTNSLGESQSRFFWEGDQPLPGDTETDRARFDRIHSKLKRLHRELQESALQVYEGPYNPAHWEEATATLLRGLPSRVDNHGEIRVGGGCEVYSEGRLSWQIVGADALLCLENAVNSEFFLKTDGTPILSFSQRIPRERLEAFLVDLRRTIEEAGANDQPSSRGARIEITIRTTGQSATRELFDELQGDKDVDPLLEMIDVFVQTCASSGAPR